MATSFPISLPWAPTGSVNQAALDTAFTTPINDLAALASWGYVTAASSTSTVTLSTTSNFAGLASATVVLSTQRHLKVTTKCRYQLGTATAGHLQLNSAYNTGSSVVIGSAVQLGITEHISANVSGLNGSAGGTAIADQVFTAGTYTFYAVVARTNGATSDLAGSWYLLVEDLGSA